ncbi:MULTISPECIES: phage tail tube protein [Catenuloplanes]|uniref:Uncharacterized protein n=1 Tax=Catenuloplanes niger TaxID=587534 RepID=A0AAE3ZRD0_9ACTN|nr:hypothetical protein [Catenuloplanes niger]MDR7323375.1 hypothetical protein [Catenuloplanes niger]
MANVTIQPGQIKTGPGVIRWAPLGTAAPAPTAVGGKIAVTWDAAWLQVGATDAGLTYTESTSTEQIRVAESLYAVKTVTTEKSGTVAFEMNHISDVNWKLAMNGGTITVTGSNGTKLSSYVPPLTGNEVRVQLAFLSYDDEELIWWPQVFNGGSVETARGTVETKAGLPVEFAAELPDAAVLATPYKRWTAGSLAQGV